MYELRSRLTWRRGGGRGGRGGRDDVFREGAELVGGGQHDDGAAQAQVLLECFVVFGEFLLHRFEFKLAVGPEEPVRLFRQGLVVAPDNYEGVVKAHGPKSQF